MNSPVIRLGATIAVASILGACGGGGDDANQPQPPTVEGIYFGSPTTPRVIPETGETTTGHTLVVLEDRSYWMLYGRTFSAGQFSFQGFIQGHATDSGVALASSDARDFGRMPVLSGTLGIDYVAGTSANGKVTFGSEQIPFSSGVAPKEFLDYAKPAKAADITGTWDVSLRQGLASEFAPLLNIAADGSYSTVVSGCQISGRITPRATGKNVYDMTMTFGPVACAQPGTTMTGIVVHYDNPTWNRIELLGAVVSTDRTAGVALHFEKR